MATELAEIVDLGWTDGVLFVTWASSRAEDCGLHEDKEDHK